MSDQHPPASDLSKQWRELTKDSRKTVATDGPQVWARSRQELGDALIAAADACDQHELKNRALVNEVNVLVSENRTQVAENATLRELLATARKALNFYAAWNSRLGYYLDFEVNRDHGRKAEIALAAMDAATKG